MFKIKLLVAFLYLLNTTFVYASFELPPLQTDDDKLVGIKPIDTEIHKAIAKALSDSNSSVRNAVALALKEIKPTDIEVLREIAKLLEHENEEIRQEAAEVLKAIKQ